MIALANLALAKNAAANEPAAPGADSESRLRSGIQASPSESSRIAADLAEVLAQASAQPAPVPPPILELAPMPMQSAAPSSPPPAAMYAAAPAPPPPVAMQPAAPPPPAAVQSAAPANPPPAAMHAAAPAKAKPAPRALPPELAQPVPMIRTKMPSYDGIPTSMIQVSPAFLDALRRLAPKKKSARLPYVIGVALCLVVGVLGVDRSTRNFVVDEGHALVNKTHAAPPAPAPEPSGVTPAQPASPVADTTNDPTQK